MVEEAIRQCPEAFCFTAAYLILIVLAISDCVSRALIDKRYRIEKKKRDDEIARIMRSGSEEQGNE